MSETTKVLLIGAGGVGIYFSGRLAQAGAEVSVVARGDYATVVNSGYAVESTFGDFHFSPHAVLRSVEEYKDTPDYVIVATKVLPQANPVALLRGAVKSPKTVIVLIQNGIDIERKVAEAFPQNQLLSTIAYIGASRPASGKVRQQGSAELKTGVFPAGISPEARRLSELFAASGVKCELCADIRFVRWNKLLWNLPFNPVSVLSGGADTREMTQRDELETLCWELMLEVIAIANACDVALSEKEAHAQMEYTRNFPPYKTSMLQDFEAGRELEVEAILGNAIRLGQQHNVDTPHMETCYALLKTLNAKRMK